MTKAIEPVLRHMILCDDVRTDAANPKKINVFGLVSTIEATAGTPFPLQHPELCVYIQLAGGRGSAKVRVEIVQADEDKTIFRGRPHALVFGNDPLSVKGLVFRIRKCRFPEPGLHWVRFRWAGKILGKQPLLVR